MKPSMRMFRARAFAALVAGVLALPAAAAELVMFEEVGCSWCEEWREVIGPIYPKTAEAARAPLRIVELSDPLPDGLHLKAPVVFTPTFVLVQDGQEVGRIEGYPGEDFFWGLLGQLLTKLPEDAGT